jgi:hypothetical protein
MTSFVKQRMLRTSRVESILRRSAKSAVKKVVVKQKGMVLEIEGNGSGDRKEFKT